MKMRAFWMLGLALLLAGGSVFLARSWLEDQVKPVIVTKNVEAEIEVTKVVVAGAPLQFGNAVRREHLRMIEWPSRSMPEGAFTSIDELLGEEERFALRPIEVNEPVLKSKITGYGERAILSSIIKKNMRAMTIRVNDVAGVAGFVLPGDHVDINLTRSKGGKGGLMTDILLQRVKVLGIGQDANDTRQKAAVVKAVTLEVTPSQGQKLILAAQLGSLSLSLRNMTNADAIPPKRVTERDLDFGEANLPNEPEPSLFASVGESAPEPKPLVVKQKIVKQPINVVSTNRKDPLSAVRIVRALKASKVEVPKEKQSSRPSSATASAPLDLLSVQPIGANAISGTSAGTQ